MVKLITVMKINILVALLCVTAATATAQDVQPILGTYLVAETCTIAEDSTYRESADYVLTIEALPDEKNKIRFLIPAHGIPDFVEASTINGKDFTFSQAFPLEDSTRFQDIAGKGRVSGNSFSMEYTSTATGVWGTLQCSAMGNRNDVGVKDNGRMEFNIRVDVQNEILIFPEQLKEKSIDFELFNMNGQRMFNRKNVGSEEISIASLPAGVYIYKLISGGHLLSTGKILKSW
ncbi:MAG: T9SS type A sorting domain-containing protein [Bacteroides sp.]|nr:T9SS type A sorting domain-containing protein [Bacteroides sp.]MCM1086043.1 T9SS type A sorting domain-containing protein [Bacteroides sp.]